MLNNRSLVGGKELCRPSEDAGDAVCLVMEIAEEAPQSRGCDAVQSGVRENGVGVDAEHLEKGECCRVW